MKPIIRTRNSVAPLSTCKSRVDPWEASRQPSASLLIADHEPLTRVGVRSVLEPAGFFVVADVGDASEAVDAAVRYRPELCLLEIDITGGGIWAADQITRQLPSTAVVMLAASIPDDALFDVIQAGAVGLVRKDMDLVRLPEVLRGVLAGEAALSRAQMALVMHQLRDRGRSRRVPVPGRPGVLLTSREREVAEMLRSGLGTKEMAARLFVSSATVRSHLSAVLTKLGAHDREDARLLLSESG